LRCQALETISILFEAGKNHSGSNWLRLSTA